MGKAGIETGLRRTYTLNKAAVQEEQEVGVEAEPEQEPNEVVEEPIDTPIETPEKEIPPTVEPLTEETPPLEEVAAEEVPAVEEEPAIEEVVEEIPEEEVIVKEEPEPEVEPEPEPEVEEEPEPEPEPVAMDFSMVLSPETPVFVEDYQHVEGMLVGFEPNEPLHITIEKSTSGENGWFLWTERNVRLIGERTPA